MQGIDSTMRTPRIVRGAHALILWVAVFFSPVSFAGAPHLLMDINTTTNPVNSDPVLLGHVGSTYLFGGKTSASTAALYQTDFTPSGTIPIKTFAGSGPLFTLHITNFLPDGGRAYFAANETATGSDVWVTDGTANGTHIVADLPSPGQPQLIGLIGTDLLFFQADENDVRQLFRTDGTAAGTRALTHLTAPQFPTGEAVIANGKIYFAVSPGGPYNPDLWVSDGTPGGTHYVGDPVTLPSGIQAQSLTAFGNSVLFIATDNTYGTELRRLDTATDTVTVLDLNPGAGASGVMSDSHILAMNGFALFVGTTSNVEGFELYRTDGTLAGTSRVADINPGTAGAFDSSRPWMAKVGNYALFFAQDAAHGMQIWGSDGTSANTAALTTSPPGNGSGSVPIAVVGSHAYFGMSLGTLLAGGSTEVLMATDGTPGGTHQVLLDLVLDRDVPNVTLDGDDSVVYFRATTTTPTNPVTTNGGIYKYEPATNRTTPLKTVLPWGVPLSVAVDAGRLLFVNYDGALGMEPWVSDGTAAGTTLLKNVAPEVVNNSSMPASLTDFNGKLWFLADDGVHGQEPWQSDGTAAGTKLVADITGGKDSTGVQQQTMWNGNLYFFVSDGLNSAFVRFDGTAAQTLAVLWPPPNIPQGSQSYCLRRNYVVLGSKLYFSAMDAQGDVELWSTDGTPAGTSRVVDLLPVSSSNPCGLTLFKNRIWFGATNSVGQSKLWSTDGTAAGTTPFPDRWTAVGPALVYNDALYLSTSDANGVTQTWKTDGTDAGTRPLVDTASGATPYSAIPIGIVNGRLLLLNLLTPTVGQTSTYRYELWFSDGTSAGTAKIQSTTAVYGGAFLITPNLLYFSGTGPAGLEPWVSDGTEAGTRLLADLNPNGDSSPAWAANFNGVVYIQAKDPVRGPRLWRTDATTTGTVAVGDVGDSSGNPMVSGQNLYFTAIDPVMGRELYVLSNDAPVAANDSGSSANGAVITLNVTGNDADTDGTVDNNTVRIVAGPAHGSAAVGTGGNITYTPTAGYSGADSFTYTVADNQGNASNAATVSLTVTAAPSSGGSGNSGGTGGSSGSSGTGNSSSGGGGGGGALGVLDLFALFALWWVANRFQNNRSDKSNDSSLRRYDQSGEHSK